MAHCARTHEGTSGSGFNNVHTPRPVINRPFQPGGAARSQRPSALPSGPRASTGGAQWRVAANAAPTSADPRAHLLTAPRRSADLASRRAGYSPGAVRRSASRRAFPPPAPPDCQSPSPAPHAVAPRTRRSTPLPRRAAACDRPLRLPTHAFLPAAEREPASRHRPPPRRAAFFCPPPAAARAKHPPHLLIAAHPCPAAST